MYDGEPDRCFELKGQDVGSFEFGIGDDPELVSLEMNDREGKSIGQIKGWIEVR